MPRENIVFISGIGCSSRFPYYMNTYGMHSIHGRAPAIATGLSTSRPDLSVWVVTGDGDALSIGGNHLIHALRRNVNLKILLFNNRIYGLTKGQYSPTSELGKITKSTPMGSLDHPFNPVSVALGAEATFVGPHDRLRPQAPQSVLRAAADHQGTALVEIYQNCNIFNDGAFDVLKDSDDPRRLDDPRSSTASRCASAPTARRPSCATPFGDLSVADDVADDDPRVVVHDAHREDPSYAFALSRLSSLDRALRPDGRVPRRRAPGLRRDDEPTQLDDRGGQGAERRGRAADACCSAPTPGRSADRRRPRRSDRGRPRGSKTVRTSTNAARPGGRIRSDCTVE